VRRSTPLLKGSEKMPLDGITLYSVANELKKLIDSSVQKIYQPEKDEILLVLHTK
jgi:predicted ribosome quality control (RQC) complex YloA/Tae2 family protein